MNRRTALFSVPILIVIFALLLSACAPAASPSSRDQASAPRAEEPASAPAGSGAYPPFDGELEVPAAEPDFGMPEEAAGEEPAEQEAQPLGTVVPGTSPLAFEPSGSQLVIKDAQLNLLVQDSAAALSRVTGMVGELNGYIISSQTWYQDTHLHASLRIGIPSRQFEDALNQLRRIGLSVLSENAQGQDVTDEYVDLQSRLTNLEATAARVRAFLDDARTVEDSLRISQELSELEAQIEKIKGQMRYFENRAAYSTVTVTLTPQYPTPTPTATATATATPTATPAWNPGQTFDDASGVLATQFRGFVDAVIWIGVVFGPWIALILLAFMIARAIARRSLPKGR